MRQLFAAILVSLSTLVGAVPSPQETVLDGVNEVVQVVQKYPGVSPNDPAFMAEVDDVLADKVSYARIVYGVMGEYWTQANRDQRIAFYQAFRESMVNTYARAMLQFSELDIALAEDQGDRQDSLTNTQVFVEALADDGSRYLMSQSVYYDEKNERWMLQNITVNGINMGSFFRRQFEALLRETNGDLNAAIERWSAYAQAEYEETSFR
ncbi:MlaC/ttg2D family ABC transporter substrate-binding protein [Salinibius halmophilus]|uniref:MlaC/ttg2D family ABC transporter substrate-binding protein n=1 Tax=Salinibius halmophilus TaxID=1853216 RepID=UPI000E6639B8|nr:ABC transporter substrate-binding protein [Salinibius halmophilus]